MPEEPKWYALRTRSRSEKKVARLLREREVEAYCPVVPRERQWADRKKTVSFPMFPGYVFACFDLRHVSEVFRVPGVATVVRTAGVPTPVRPEELEAVRRLERGVTETGQEPVPADFLEPGDEVKVVDGPFEGMTGVLVEARGRARVTVRLTAIRQAVSIELPRDLVEPTAAGVRHE